MSVPGRVIAGVDWRMRPVLKAKKEDTDKIGRGVPAMAIVGDGAKEFLMGGSVNVMVASKEVLVSFVGRGADWAFVRVMPVDAMFL